MDFNTVKDSMLKKAAGPGFGFAGFNGGQMPPRNYGSSGFTFGMNPDVSETVPNGPYLPNEYPNPYGIKQTYKPGFTVGNVEVAPDLSGVKDDVWFRIGEYLKNRYYNTVSSTGRTLANIASFGNPDLYNSYREWAQKAVPEFTSYGEKNGLRPVAVKMGLNPGQIFKKIDKRDNLQKIYDASAKTYNTFKDLGNYEDYKTRPDIPEELYRLAEYEAALPKYDMARTRGLDNKKIQNYIARTIYPHIINEVHGGIPWTTRTKFSDDEWKRIDDIMKNRYIKSLDSSPEAQSYTQEQKNALINDWEKEYKEHRKPPEFNLEEAKKKVRPFRQV